MGIHPDSSSAEEMIRPGCLQIGDYKREMLENTSLVQWRLWKSNT